MSKTLIDIPSDVLNNLSDLAKKEDVSRSQLIRQILDSWLKVQKQNTNLSKNVFGILKNKKIDGLKLQHKIRKEW